MRIALTERACVRAAAGVHRDLNRGLNLLATISATAPWLGLLLTAYGIVHSFKGCGCEKSQMLAMLASGFSGAFHPAAFGLATAIVAWITREHCRSTIAGFDAEMRAATLDLLNRLAQAPKTA